MAYEQKEMGGALFKNDKGDNPARPDYRGDCKIGGRVLKISAWLKDKRDGSGKYMSLAFEDKAGPSGAAPVTPSQPPAARGEANDDLPF